MNTLVAKIFRTLNILTLNFRTQIWQISAIFEQNVHRVDNFGRSFFNIEQYNSNFKLFY